MEPYSDPHEVCRLNETTVFLPKYSGTSCILFTILQVCQNQTIGIQSQWFPLIHWGFRSHPKTMLFIFPFKTEMIGSCILRVFFLVHSNFFLLKIASLCWSNPYMSWKNHKFQWINFHLLTLKSHFNKVIILRVQTPIVIIYHWYSASPKLPFPRAVALVGRRHALPPAPRAPWRRQGRHPAETAAFFLGPTGQTWGQPRTPPVWPSSN